jgi:hypothetical protein
MKDKRNKDDEDRRFFPETGEPVRRPSGYDEHLFLTYRRHLVKVPRCYFGNAPVRAGVVILLPPPADKELKTNRSGFVSDSRIRSDLKGPYFFFFLATFLTAFLTTFLVFLALAMVYLGLCLLSEIVSETIFKVVCFG